MTVADREKEQFDKQHQYFKTIFLIEEHIKLIMWPWANYLGSRHLGFLFYKVRILIVFTSQVC